VLGSLGKKDSYYGLLLGRGSPADNERFAEILAEMKLSPVEKLHGKDDEIMDSVSYVLQANPKLSQAYDLYVPHWQRVGPGCPSPLHARSVSISLRLTSVTVSSSSSGLSSAGSSRRWATRTVSAQSAQSPPPLQLSF